jgi:hypothetical protein
MKKYALPKIGDIHDVSDIELRAFFTLHPLYGGDALGAHREQFPGVENKRAPFLGQRDPIVRPVQQPNPDFIFDIMHLPREGGLAEPKLW